MSVRYVVNAGIHNLSGDLVGKVVVVEGRAAFRRRRGVRRRDHEAVTWMSWKDDRPCRIAGFAVVVGQVGDMISGRRGTGHISLIALRPGMRGRCFGSWGSGWHPWGV